MPGHALYPASRALDEIGKFWNFGPIAQAKYYLHLADKYLVEAKTLFEYGQYQLALDALNRSNNQINGVHNREAMQRHVEVLSNLKSIVPEQYIWQPEKQKASQLLLWDAIDHAITVRQDSRI